MSLLGNLPGEPVPKKTADDLELVLQEACVNAIKHSGCGGSYAVAFILTPDSITIEVRDRGLGFDPDRVPDPVPANLCVNGYGVFIIKKSMDRVTARRDGGEFVLSMSKRLHATGSTAEGVGR